MLKLKNAIIRYTNKVNKSRRSSSFLQDPFDNVQIELDELTDIEKTQFILWWDDLNPFHLNELDNTKTLDFLSKFELPENKLEQILSLFRDQKKGLNRAQFFAVLRLIGHAQHGKSINPAYIHIGAPLPSIESTCDTRSSVSALHSPPFDECIRNRRSKSYPFVFSNSTTNGTYKTSLLLTQPFKPKFINVNIFSNSNQVAPPPVPPQSTKPNYLKYTRRMSR